jgi:hypothetical protein
MTSAEFRTDKSDNSGSPAPDMVATREAWLHRAINHFRPRFQEIEYPLPATIHVSVGWGSTGARQENAAILGVTYHSSRSEDGNNHVFVTPEDADTTSILITLLHELIHVALDNEDGHRGRFREIALLLGFVPPMTETPAGIELAAEMMTLAASLGDYPHSKLSPVFKDAEIPVGPDGNPINITPGKPVRISSGKPPQINRRSKMICPFGHDYGMWATTKIVNSPPACGECLDDGVVTRMVLQNP